MARRSRINRRTISMPDVNLTPLIDTALVLLVVFMVTAPIMKHGIKVDLPEGKVQEVQQPKQDLVVYIDKEQKLYCNDKSVATEQQLLDLLKQNVARAPDRTVFVKADRSVNYGKVIELVDQIKCVGDIKYVALATSPRR